jgi:hypothetical protein
VGSKGECAGQTRRVHLSGRRKKDVIITGGENCIRADEDFCVRTPHQNVAVTAPMTARRNRSRHLQLKEGVALPNGNTGFCLDLPVITPKKIIFADVPSNPTGKSRTPPSRKYCGRPWSTQTTLSTDRNCL